MIFVIFNIDWLGIIICFMNRTTRFLHSTAVRVQHERVMVVIECQAVGRGEIDGKSLAFHWHTHHRWSLQTIGGRSTSFGQLRQNPASQLNVIPEIPRQLCRTYPRLHPPRRRQQSATHGFLLSFPNSRQSILPLHPSHRNTHSWPKRTSPTPPQPRLMRNCRRGRPLRPHSPS